MSGGVHLDRRDQFAWTRRRVLRQGVAVAGIGILAASGCAPSVGPRSKIPTVGFVSPGLPGIDWFLGPLRALGQVEGKTVTIDPRNPVESEAEITPVIEEFVRLPADVIVCIGSTAARIGKASTRTIPVVFWGVADAERLGLVKSLARPEANVTGVTNFSAKVVGKGLDYLLQIVPGTTRVAFVGNLKGNPGSPLQLEAVKANAATIGLEIVEFAVHDAADIDLAFASFPGSGIKAVMIGSDAIMNINQQHLVDTAARYRIPTMYPRREFPDAGGLIGYGPNYAALNERLAVMVDKILKGAKPGDLPVEQPTKLDFVINLKTAAALPLTIPQSVLAQATDVIR